MASESQEALIEELIKVLEDIKTFGYANPGCGWSCAKKARECLEKYFI